LVDQSPRLEYRVKHFGSIWHQTSLSPKQIAVPAAYEAFNDEGELIDAELGQRVKALGAQIANMASRLND